MGRTRAICTLGISITVTILLVADIQISKADTAESRSITPSAAVSTGTTSTVSATTTYAYLPLISNPASPSVYWGALVGVNSSVQAPTNESMQPGGVFDTYETHLNKRLSILHWGQTWMRNGVYDPFYAPYFDNVRNHGSIPLLDWGSTTAGGGTNQPTFKLSAIYNGNHDSFIRQWALDAKTWGHPFFLRFDWEMNGDWQFPWSEQLNGNQPGDYIKAWRHVHDIFTQNGVKNVTWVWCPNISGGTTLPMASLYPGDSYVDWTCLDGYNKYTGAWLGFNTIFTGSGINWLSNSYQEILAAAPSKPIMIGEFASLEAGDGGPLKAAWITDALITQLPNNFPAIKAIVWFNWNDGVPSLTLPLESTQTSLNAFKNAIDSSYYAENNFANLNISPIPPLP